MEDLLLELTGIQVARIEEPHEAVAIVDRTTTITYADLHYKLARRMEWLRSEGVVAGSLVSLPPARTADTVVTMLAALAVGAAYFPSASPASDRTVTDLKWPKHLFLDDAPAYVLPTSGSGGVAKATVVTRAGLRAVFSGLHRRLHLTLPPAAVWTQLHPLTFGFSVFEVLGCFMFGGTLRLVERENPLTLADFAFAVESTAGPVVASMTPSELSMYTARDPSRLPTHLVLSGEPLHRLSVNALNRLRCENPPVILNTYAATETSGQITAHVVDTSDFDSAFAGYVGRPLPGIEVTLERKDGTTIPATDTDSDGTIIVRGNSVAAGYFEDGEPHRSRFLYAPRPTYRTGDRGRWARDGGLFVLGRDERLVKISGVWIDLDRIERVLMSEGLVNDCVAAVEQYSASDAAILHRLLVICVPISTSYHAVADCRRRIVEMTSRSVALRMALRSTIPRSRNGKVRIDGQGPQSDDGDPVSVPEQVHRVWSAFLGEGLDPAANVFDAGLDSLTLVAVAERLTVLTGRPITPNFIFDNPTLDQQTARLSGEARIAGPRASLPASESSIPNLGLSCRVA